MLGHSAVMVLLLLLNAGWMDTVWSLTGVEDIHGPAKHVTGEPPICLSSLRFWGKM